MSITQQFIDYKSEDKVNYTRDYMQIIIQYSFVFSRYCLIELVYSFLKTVLSVQSI